MASTFASALSPGRHGNQATVAAAPRYATDDRDENNDSDDDDDNNEPSSEQLAVAKARYHKYAMDKYDDLFEELEFRCQRAAMMHYHEANYYAKRCYYLELAAALLGAASVSGLGAFLVKWTGSSSSVVTSACSSTTSRLGIFGVFGAAVAGLLQFASKGTSNVLPSMCKRAFSHKKAAIGWQKLTRLTKSCRIRLRDPGVTVADYVEWYTNLVGLRESVSSLALVPTSTYRAFNDPCRIFSSLRKKRNMFLSYQQMFEGKLEVKDDFYDDD